MVEELLYVRRNRRLIRDGCPDPGDEIQTLYRGTHTVFLPDPSQTGQRRETFDRLLSLALIYFSSVHTIHYNLLIVFVVRESVAWLSKLCLLLDATVFLRYLQYL